MSVSSLTSENVFRSLTPVVGFSDLVRTMCQQQEGPTALTPSPRSRRPDHRWQGDGVSPCATTGRARRGRRASAARSRRSGRRPPVTQYKDFSRLPTADEMTTSLVMSTQSLATVKSHFSAVVDSVHSTHERVVVTRNGEPSVVVVAVEDLESLEETLAILRDEKTMRDLASAEAEVAAGETVDADELRNLMHRRSSAT